MTAGDAAAVTVRAATDTDAAPFVLGLAPSFVAEHADGTPLGFIDLPELPDLTGRPRAHVSDAA